MEKREWIEIQDSSASLDCHVLPCAVKYTGRVNGSKFVVNESPELVSRLRGRQLHGYRVDLKKYGFTGYTLEQKQILPKDSDDEDENQSFYEIPEIQLVPDSRPFDKLIVWEHGGPPSKLDPLTGRLEELLEFSKYM